MAADAQIRVRFDRQVRLDSIRPRFHVEPRIVGCDLDLAWSAAAGAPCRITLRDGGAEFRLDHRDAPFQADTKYTFRLDGGFVDVSGISNSLDHRWEVTTGAAPRVGSVVPPDGATSVAADTSVVITFNSHMRAGSISQAVTLDPPVPGTRVYGNALDRGRYVVLPGRLLTPGRTYTVRVGSAATEEHGLGLAAPFRARFTVGGIGHDGHALVLTAPGSGRPADQVLLTALRPRLAGDPVAAAVVYEAPRCVATSCGALGTGEPLLAVAEAAVSPDAQRLALVLQDRQSQGGTQLVIQPTIGGSPLAVATGASHVSWSPDSTRLAFSRNGEVHLVSAANGADLTLPPGAPLAAPLLWEPDGAGLVLPVGTAGDPGTTRGVDLADAALGIRYPLPALRGELRSPSLSPSGVRLAVRRDGDPATDGTWTVPLAGGAGAGGTPVRVAPDLTPVAWAGESTLLAVAQMGSNPVLVRLNLASGDRTTIPGLLPGELASLVVTSSGRQLAFLHVDQRGAGQAFVENADGSNPTPLTPFLVGGRAAVAVSVSG